MSRNGGSGTLSHNFTDAQSSWFVDYSNGDLHLVAGHPAVVDQAIGLADVEDDIDCQPRPLDDGFDIGADEYIYTCLGDLDLDNDVDGRDAFIWTAETSVALEAIASGFGQTDCP